MQSVAVRLIVEREREIRAFTPEEYWEAFADLQRAGDGTTLRFQVIRDGEANFRPADKASTDAALERLRARDFRVRSRDDRPTRTRPNPPFITSTPAAGGQRQARFPGQENDDRRAAAL